MTSRILVIAAHPDDEILGVGGTVRRHTLAGDVVHSIVLCEGVSMRYSGKDVPQAEQGQQAAKQLGVRRFEILGFPDQHLDTLSLVDIISPLEKHVREFRPEIIYAHHPDDVNRDHRLVFEAVMVACRPIEASIQAIHSFQSPSSTEWHLPYSFSPNYFVDISETLEDKLTAFSYYETEVREYPHPRSLQSLRNRAHYWGNLVNMSAAEPFVTWRRLWR